MNGYPDVPGEVLAACQRSIGTIDPVEVAQVWRLVSSSSYLSGDPTHYLIGVAIAAAQDGNTARALAALAMTDRIVVDVMRRHVPLENVVHGYDAHAAAVRGGAA